MTKGFATIPEAGAYVLADARLPAAAVEGFDARVVEGLLRADLVVEDGRIARLSPPNSETGLPVVDLDGGQVWPAFVDLHTHLDKGHIWPRAANPDGSFDGALAAVHADREANWSAEDVRRRMDFALRCACAHGTRLIRTHLDSLPPQETISWPVFAEMRAAWAGRIELQAVSLFPVDMVFDAAAYDAIVDTTAAHGGVLGGVTFMIPELDAALDRLFETAAARGLDLDFHVDETQDPAATSLRSIAEAALRHRFEGRVAVGHCCSLARQDEAEAARTIERVAEAGITVISLPMCNVYLQDRAPGRTPRSRGVTLLKEMAAAGVNTVVASDNTRDPFYAYGDLDPMEVFREAVRIIQLDHPIDAAPALVTRNAANAARRPDLGLIRAGDPADLVLFRARRWTELLARPQADRTVIRAGRAIDRTLPDHRELDDLFGDLDG
ncbi:cytosine deaminase [Prosthecomicrobium pneumaticum]|uniref:Cytosine deaminase n=1 Tax=Prosthecomicrobium pneumaticum TaxID=81895 RepID=A0A7W9CVR8_9HYPH|nr:cytosine deaminase [Prosthecomicrobium pneumaticum]MBB5752508.1 cytosine deaminase [Prosthecomicrobium pneumaticum]